MQRFSLALARLYEIAEEADPSRFPQEAIRLLQTFVGFDGAALGLGYADEKCAHNLRISQAHVHQRDDSLLDDYQAVSASDPVTRAFMQGLAEPLHCDCAPFYKAHRLPALAKTFARHDVRHLLLVGLPPSSDRSARWLALYKGTDDGFHRRESHFIHCLWTHLSRAISINFNFALNRSTPEQMQRAMAVISPSGHIEVADPAFLQLYRAEWPDETVCRLPRHALSTLMQDRFYKGRHLRLSMFVQAGATICQARPTSFIDRLSPAEKNVAHFFVAGHDYKEIALRMQTSPNTVRNQLASVYRKLNVHDKLSLSQLLERA